MHPKDPGAVGGGFVEAELAVDLRDRVAAELRALGCDVIEDGADGVSEPLKKAIALARTADIAVEFHWNAAASAKATGIEVLAKAKHKRLSRQIAQAIAGVTTLEPRGDNGWRADNSGQHHRLAFCEAGGLIVEVCFISNASDMATYNENKADVARAIADVLAVAAGVASPPATAGGTDEAAVYTVKAGDSLWQIAGHFNTTVAALRAANNLPSDMIRPGQKLRVKL